jgi:hypothetical protein
VKIMLFKKHLLHKVLDGSKTQTRRRRTSKVRYRVGSIQPVKTTYYEKAQGHIKIKRRFEQRLLDMTEEEAKAEGYSNLEAFRKEWPQITKQPLNLQETVTAYEFDRAAKTGKPSSAGESQQS